MTVSMKEKNNWQIAFLKGFMFFTPFLFGGYHMFVSAFMSVVLCVFLLVCTVMENSKAKLQITVTTAVMMLVPLSYLAVNLWAVDSGTAIYGFIKFLPIALFAVAVSFYSTSERQELLQVMPYSAVAMGVISYLLSFIPECESFFLVASRLGGFFQAPNAFAAYCLAGVALLLLKNKLTYKEWIMSAVLVALIFLTGSRTVFVFMLAVSIALLIRVSPKNRIRLIALVGAAVAVSIVVVIATDSVQTVGRYLTISLESSTLLGRVLYYKDAVIQILRHPFGLGYYGYYYSQGSFQSGVYSVAFVHNEALQMLLDIGWIPSVVFFFVLGKSFFSKNTSFAQKTVLFIIFGHSMFDFDLQFISVFLVLILTLDFDTRKLCSVKMTDMVMFAVTVVVVLTNLYFGIVNSLYLMGKYEQVEKIYGADTQSEIQLMINEKDYDKIIVYAESILSRNEYVAVAYDAAANYFFSKGKFTQVIELKEKAIECARYSIVEYDDFCSKLIQAINIYRANGDSKSVSYCEKQLLEVYDRLENVKETTSSIAWKLKDKPELELNDLVKEYIKELKK
jgi:tetratricopeptide (TPR) repeat protein